MPELPEVETTCRGIEPYVNGSLIRQVVVRQPRLRWPVNESLNHELQNQILTGVARRAKYILLTTIKGVLVIHLGMSGSLRVVNKDHPVTKHDHCDLVLQNDLILRYNDPRRFGAILWITGDLQQHALFAHLGPEPLASGFSADYLHARSKQRKTAIKTFIMDASVVVGVGNIYANEALFMAGIHPKRQAGRISLQRYQRLVIAIKNVLQQAIEQGGTTLKDFVNGEGKPGYFQQSLLVYGKDGGACPQCEEPIRKKTIAQRSSFYCVNCQV